MPPIIHMYCSCASAYKHKFSMFVSVLTTRLDTTLVHGPHATHGYRYLATAKHDTSTSMWLVPTLVPPTHTLFAPTNVAYLPFYPERVAPGAKRWGALLPDGVYICFRKWLWLPCWLPVFCIYFSFANDTVIFTRKSLSCARLLQVSSL